MRKQGFILGCLVLLSAPGGAWAETERHKTIRIQVTECGERPSEDQWQVSFFYDSTQGFAFDQYIDTVTDPQGRAVIEFTDNSLTASGHGNVDVSNPATGRDLAGHVRFNIRYNVAELDVVVPIEFDEDNLPPGDTNGDCFVDIEDLNNVRNNFGRFGVNLLGDANGDLWVDIEDLNLVRNNFGR